MGNRNTKHEYGIPQFKDNFLVQGRLADEALKVGDTQNYVSKTIEAIEAALGEREELEKMKIKDVVFSEAQILHELRYRESYIENRLTKLMFNVKTGSVKYPSGRLDQELSKISNLYDAKRILKYVRVKVKVKLLARKRKEQKNSLMKMLENEEDGQTECKKSFDLKDAITKTIISFANTEGGSVYIGIVETRYLEKEKEKDQGAIPINSKFYAVGVPKNLDDHRIKLIQFISEKTNIDISKLTIKLLYFQNKTIVQIIVPPLFRQFGTLYFFNGDAYRRLDNQNKKLGSRETYELGKSYHTESKTSVNKNAPKVFLVEQEAVWASNYGGHGASFLVVIALDNYGGKNDYVTNITIEGTNDNNTPFKTDSFTFEGEQPNHPYPIKADDMKNLRVFIASDHTNHRPMPDLDTDTVKLVVTFRSRKTTKLPIKIRQN